MLRQLRSDFNSQARGRNGAFAGPIKWGAGSAEGRELGSGKCGPRPPRQRFFRSLRRHVTYGLLHSTASHPWRATAAAGP